MIVVMQCASRKRKQGDAGFMRTQDGRQVCFVADPAQAPEGEVGYATTRGEYSVTCESILGLDIGSKVNPNTQIS
jgi:hypothetical protein